MTTRSKEEMETNGWEVSATAGYPSEANNVCMAGGTWYGFTGGSTIGSISATFIGSGRATLDFGNCYNNGLVTVYVNEIEVARASETYPEITSVQATFDFTPGDVLRISEDFAIIKLNSLHITCSGRYITLICDVE